MNGRGFSGSYRFGYQGSEKDNEVSGEGNSYTTEFRQLDPRLGRWFSVDPWAEKYPYISPYTSMHNDPIGNTDIKGLGPNPTGNRYTYTNTEADKTSEKNGAWSIFVTQVLSKDPKASWSDFCIANAHLLQVKGDKVVYKDGKLSVGAVFITDPNEIKARVSAAKLGVQFDYAIWKQGQDKPQAKITQDKKTLEMEKKVDFTSSEVWKNEANSFDYSIANENDTWRTRFNEFNTGTGPTNLYYPPEHQMNKAIRDMDHIDAARKFFYNKYSQTYKEGKFDGKATVTNYGASFPLSDVPKYGFNANKQFIGSATIFIYTSADAKSLIFVVANTTSKTSYHYHQNLVNPKRTSENKGANESTLQNLYIWSEPIDPSKFK